MNSASHKYKILNYFLIVFSLFILLVFTKDMFFEMQSLQDQHSSLQKNFTEKELERAELKALQKTSLAGTEPYVKTLKENELIEYLYNLAEDVNTSRGLGAVVIKSLSIGESAKNDLGFLESQIDLEIQFGSEAKMTRFLDELVEEDAPYKFFIDTFSYQIPEKKLQSGGLKKSVVRSFTVTIPLRFFYK